LSDGSEVNNTQVMIAKSKGVINNVNIIVINFKKESIVIINFCVWEVILGEKNFIIENEARNNLLVSRRDKLTNFRAREK
jgi:hypothetical protein